MEHSAKQDWRAYVGVLLLVAVPLGIYFVYPIRVVVIVSLLTLLFAVVLAAPVDYLARRGAGRAWGLLAVAVGLFLLMQLAEIAVIPLVAQSQRLIGDFPRLLTEAQGLVVGLPFGLGGGLAPLLDPTRLTGVLQSSGLSAATVLNVGTSAANLLSFGTAVFLTGFFVVLYPAPLVMSGFSPYSGKSGRC